MCVCVLFYVCLSQMLVGSPLLCNLVDSFQGPSFTRDVFLPSFSSKPPSFSYFLSLFNDFQLFIIQRKGFRIKRCPLSAAWSSLLLFSLPRLIHVPLLPPPPPFFFFFLPPCTFFPSSCHSLVSLSFTPASHWPINHLCWREHPAVLCNFLSP